MKLNSSRTTSNNAGNGMATQSFIVAPYQQKAQSIITSEGPKGFTKLSLKEHMQMQAFREAMKLLKP